MSLYVMLSKQSETGLLPLHLQVEWGEHAPAERTFDTVLQWGIPAKEPEGVYVLNPLKCLLRAKHKKTVKELLSLHGIKTRSDQPFVREYLVPVFHMDALAVFEKKRSPAWVASGSLQVTAARYGHDGQGTLRQFRELAPEEARGYYVRRAVRQSVRSVYALGLATGLVYVGITSGGQTVVGDVDPAPRLDDRLAELFAGAINRYALELKRERSRSGGVVLGADPEFLLRRPDGRIASASKYMERGGRVGCDAVVLPRHRVILPLAELRPAPSSNPRELVRELRRTMREAADLIGDRELAWLAGSMPAKGLPLGGHIHFSGVGLSERLLRALDNYLALPLVLLEGSAAGSRRPRYGFLGDFRRKRHGGFEYRSLPSWLATPELAFAVLALAWTVALHYRDLLQRPLERANVQQAYYRGDKRELAPIVSEIWRDLETLPAYREYRSELDAFRDAIRRMEPWDEQADFRIPWKISHN